MMPAWTLKNGDSILIRPIRPEDESRMVAFHQTLSEETVFLRYAHLIKLSRRIAHDRLSRICHPDSTEHVLVAIHASPNNTAEIIAVARLNQLDDPSEAEFAILVSDRFQHQGLGTELLHHLIAIARDHNMHRIFGEILPENHGMEHICHHLGFRLRNDPNEDFVLAELEVDGGQTDDEWVGVRG
jgi:acetyltransferase